MRFGLPLPVGRSADVLFGGVQRGAMRRVLGLCAGKVPYSVCYPPCFFSERKAIK